MTASTSIRNLACVALCALPAWGLADSLRLPTTLPLNNTVRMNTTTVPMAPPAATSAPVAMPAPTTTPVPMARPADPLRVEVGDKTHFSGTTEQQLARLHRQVEALEQRLALAEKRLATHRHAYQTHGINYMNAQSFEDLLWRARNRPSHPDSLIGLPGGTLHRETGPGLTD